MTRKQPTTDTRRRTPSPAWQNLVAERNAWRTVSYALATALFEQPLVSAEVAQAYAFARQEQVS